MPWEVNAPPAQPGCVHGDGTNEVINVRMPRFPHRCPHHDYVQGAGTLFDGNRRGVGTCSHCHREVPNVGWRVERDPTSGTMVIEQAMPTPGYTAYIYRCTVCSGRFSNSPAFGAQGDTFFCGTAGNMWR